MDEFTAESAEDTKAAGAAEEKSRLESGESPNESGGYRGARPEAAGENLDGSGRWRGGDYSGRAWIS